MKVLFYGSVREHTNGDKSYEFPDTSESCLCIRDLIGKLGGYYGAAFRDFLLGSETCFLLVNGKGIMMTGGLDTKLLPGDKIELLPFVQAG